MGDGVGKGLGRQPAGLPAAATAGGCKLGKRGRWLLEEGMQRGAAGKLQLCLCATLPAQSGQAVERLIAPSR